MRALIDIPDDDLAALDKLARRNGRSRAAEMREAVVTYLRNRSGNGWIERGRGYWKDRDDVADGGEYQRTIREDRTFD